ncbi:MAG: hypothetical protein AAF493_15075 [Pseudomonadota bacterium]
MRDFFFDMPARGPITLPALLLNASFTSPRYFERALNRVVEELPGRRLNVIDDSTRPDLAGLLAHIEPDAIGRVLLSVRLERHHSSVPTIDCQLWLVNGIVHLTPRWHVDSDDHVADVESTLLTPVRQYRLSGRTWLNRYHGEGLHDWVRMPTSDGATLDLLRAMARSAMAPLRRSLLRII